MKIRTGFVSNSSSSSFTITNSAHPAVLQMVEEGIIDCTSGDICDEYDNQIWDWCYSHDYDWAEFLCQNNFDG